MTLILASTSPRRRDLAALLNIPFTIVPPDVPEDPHPGETPPDLVRRLARHKASVVHALHPDAIVLAADTVVALGGQVLGKPESKEAAEQMLRSLRGVPHHVYTGVALARGAALWDDVIATLVTMRPYTDAEIAAYIASGSPLDKAGAYGIQDTAFAPVAHLSGCYANVVGLPLCAVHRLLTHAAIPLSPTIITTCSPPTFCAVAQF